MKRIIYPVLVLICFITAGFNSIAQEVQHTQLPLGAPTVVNFTKAAEYDLTHPRSIKVHCVEQGDDDEMIPSEPVIGGDAVKNDVQSHSNLRAQSITSPAPDLTFEGWDLATTFPPDIRGAAGLSYIVQTTNEGIKIFNKSGTLNKTTTLHTFFPNASSSKIIYDPHIVYDPNNNRFIIVCSGYLGSNLHGGVFVAVSKTSDPTGDWWEYGIDGTGNTSDLFDYPLLGFNANWIVVTGNLFAGGTTFTKCRICVIDRAKAYDGSATGAIDIFDDASNITTIAPAATIDNSQTTEYLVENSAGNSGGYGYVKLATVTGPVGSPVYTLGGPVGINQPWSNTPVTVPQKGGTVQLDMRDARIGNAVYRNGSLWFVHHVFLPETTPTHSSVDWWQINPSTGTVVQFSRIDDPTGSNFYFYPGIDVNASGDALITFSQSSATMYASAAYAFHSHTDALGFTEDPYIYKAGLAYYLRISGGRDRWGDYLFSAVDPVDQSFWSFSEWAKAGTTWATEIAHLVATPDTNCNAPVALSATNITDVSVTLSWTPISAYATYYTIQYRKVGTSTWTTDTTSAKSYNVTGLTANTNYEWHVLNNCQSGSISPYSSMANFTTNGPCITKANFNASPTVFCSPPALVTFTNNSSNATTYSWSFGDGNSSTLTNPSNSYSSYGTYTVRLIATGCTVDTLIMPQYIDVDSNVACIVSLPTSGTGPTQTGCVGQLYDSGGPGGNYQNKTDVSITIAPLGAASVDVSFAAFHMEPNYDYIYIYDGPTSAYPLIGKYTGTALPNGGSSITSSSGAITIRQTSDDSVNFSGFGLTWQCAVSNVAPTANFTSDVTTSCTGTVQFTDMSTNGPTSWLWDFGDGQTSIFQNPLHTYISNGNFTVQLTATNAHGSNSLTLANYITIGLPPAPVAGTPDSICSGGYTQLSATNSGGTITWYDAPTGGNILDTGATLLTPPLFGTTTYYAESDVGGATHEVGPTDYTLNFQGTGSFFTTTNYHCLYFNCYTPMILQSVVMYASTTGNRRITLVNNGDTIQAITVSLAPGTDTVVTLNFQVPIGTHMELGVAGYTNLYRNTAGSKYPYTLSGDISITGDNSGSSGYYYYFYDWIMQDPPCTSARVPVTVTVDKGPAISYTPNLVGSVCTFNNTTTGAVTYSWNFGDPGSGSNNVSTLQNPVHTFSTTGVFNVCLKATDSKGCKNTVCVQVNVVVLSPWASLTAADENISVYPNPVSNKLTIEFGDAYAGKKWTLKLTDILGKLVAEKYIYNVQSPGRYDWDLSAITKGAYILTLQSDDKKLMRKIIRQ